MEDGTKTKMVHSHTRVKTLATHAVKKENKNKKENENKKKRTTITNPFCYNLKCRETESLLL